MKYLLLIMLVFANVYPDDFDGLTDEEKKIMRSKPKSKPYSRYQPTQESASKTTNLAKCVGIGFIMWGAYDGWARVDVMSEANKYKRLYGERLGLGGMFYIGFVVDVGLLGLGVYALNL